MRAQVDLRHGGFSGNFAFSVRELPGFFGIRRMPIINSRKETVVQAKTVPISNWQATTYRGSSNPKPDANGLLPTHQSTPLGSRKVVCLQPVSVRANGAEPSESRRNGGEDPVLPGHTILC